MRLLLQGAQLVLSAILRGVLSLVGSITRAFTGTNAPTTYGPAAGGARTTDGYSTVSLTGIGTTSQLRVRITLLNNAGAERWVVDDIIIAGTAAPAASISTGTLSSTLVCATNSSNIVVNYTASASPAPTGTYGAQLSDAAGTFAVPLDLTTTINGTNDQATATIPAATASGAGYRIRIVTKNGATLSTTGSNSAAFTIVSSPTVTIAPAANQAFLAGGSGNLLTATETPAAAGNTRVWQVASTSTGTYSDIAPVQTGLTYTPTFPTAGTYFVRVLSTFAACAAVPSSPVQVIVTANAINTPTFATTALCASSAALIDVTFTASGNYAATNNFVVQLSDAASSFAAPLTIATLANNNLTTPQMITATIPAGTPSGIGYRIQVVADDPAITSTGMSAAFTIVSNPTVSISPAATQAYAVGSPGTQLTATEAPATGNTRTWQVASAATGPFSNISPAQTGTTYTPTFTTAGTYFVRVLSTFAACAAVPSNVVEIDLANAIPTLSSLAPNTAAVGGSAFSLTVNGSGFVSGAVISFNGTALTTAFVNAGQLTASVPAAAIATNGSYPVTVTNPAPTAGASALLPFTVTNPLTACLNEDFEGGVVPTGWASSNVTIVAAAANTGAGGASFDGSTNASTLTTPELSAPASFAFALGRSTNTTAKTMIVEASTTSQTAGFSTVATYTHADVPSGGFAALSISLPAPYNTAARVWVRFRKPAGSTASPWRVDDVAVGCGTPTTPRISVAVVSTVVANGGSYGLGTVAPSSSSAVTTFSILNTGGSALTLSGTLVVAATGSTADFTVTQPVSASVAAGGSVPFTVTFSPTSNGLKTITLSITNNDGSPTRTPYVFTVRGTGGIVTPPASGNLATGELLLEEDVVYSPSTASVRTLPGWAAHSQSGVGTPVQVASGNIINPQYPMGVAGTNNQLSSLGSSEDVNRAFNRAAPTGSTTLYVSALVNISQLFGSTYFLHLLDNTQPGETVARGKLFVSEVSASSYVLGLSVSGSAVASATLGSDIYGVGDNLLVVIKYVTNPSGQDEASLFVFPATAAPATEPAVPAIGPLAEANSIGANTLNSVALRQNATTPYYTVDGIRVGTGWGSAVGKATYPQAAGLINAGNYYSVDVTNSDVLTTTGPVNVESILTLTSGLINTTAANSLTLYQTATTTGGSATSFVNGPLARVTPGGISTSTSFLFPVGKASFYRPFTVTLASQSAASTYTVEQLEGNPNPAGASNLDTGNGQGSAPLKRVSRFRSFLLTSSNSTGGNAIGTVTLSFDAGDRVNNPTDPGLVVAVSSGGSVFANLNRSVSSGSGSGPGGAEVAGTLTSSLFPTAAASAIFTLGATNDNTTFGAAINPLPVELTTFSALRQASNTVAIKWVTASEKNSARFEVERSLNGREFALIASATARGNSSSATYLRYSRQNGP
jgi:hypothetical protein